MPIATCTSQRGYAYCKFVFGEIFQLIPFASAIRAIGQNIFKALQHPAEMLGFVATILCKLWCKNPVLPGCWACSLADFGNIIADVACDLGLYGGEKCEPIWDSFSAVDEDACETALGEDEEGDEAEE